MALTSGSGGSKTPVLTASGSSLSHPPTHRGGGQSGPAARHGGACAEQSVLRIPQKLHPHIPPRQNKEFAKNSSFLLFLYIAARPACARVRKLPAGGVPVRGVRTTLR